MNKREYDLDSLAGRIMWHLTQFRDTGRSLAQLMLELSKPPEEKEKIVRALNGLEQERFLQSYEQPSGAGPCRTTTKRWRLKPQVEVKEKVVVTAP